jgi:hypothetical protein
MRQDLEKLIHEFIKEFPINLLTKMTLDRYAIGKGKESFCW